MAPSRRALLRGDLSFEARSADALPSGVSQAVAMRRPDRSPDGGVPASSQLAAPPPIGGIALNRMAFGPRPGHLDLATFQALGGSDDARLQALVDQQLAPATLDDSEVEARIAAAGLTTLGKSLPQLWADHYVADVPWSERIRPAQETVYATFLRATYGQAQLVEVLADFWHNHFNVYAWEGWHAAVWVHYDRDVIRHHLLGNFRQMLEAVAKSTAMLLYLDNWRSSADGPNENFPREMLELHTLGDENYYGTGPASQVPQDSQGQPVGFVDEDVFAATRCLTGWSLQADPWWDPKSGNGTYFYRHDWHDTGSKTVLGVTLPADQPPEKDGLDLLDILAGHPGTGRFIARKLCRRLIADDPPPSIVSAAAQVFTQNVAAPDQLARVVRAILLSQEFRTTWGEKVKRPFEIVASAMRAGGAELSFSAGDSATDSFDWLYHNTGQDLFSWRPPNGYPDRREDWVSSGPRVMTWRLCAWLSNLKNDLGAYRMDALSQMPAHVRSAAAVVDFWIDRVFGRPIAPGDRLELVEFMAQGHNSEFDLPLASDEATQDRLQALLGLLFMMPEFLRR